MSKTYTQEEVDVITALVAAAERKRFAWTQEHWTEYERNIAAAERERIITANAPEIEKVNAHIKALEDAVAAEREAWQKEREQLMIQIGVLRSQILGIRMEFGESTTVSNLSAALQAEDAVNAAAIRARSAK